MVTGPFNATGSGDTPSRRAHLRLPASRVAADEPPVRAAASLARLARLRLSPHADRRGHAAADAASTRRDGRRASRPASSWRCGRCWPARSSSCASSATRPASAPAAVYRVSDVDLASRLSFFLWSSIPDDELLDVAERGQLHDTSGARRAGPAHARRSESRRADDRTSPASGCRSATSAARRRTRTTSRISTTTCGRRSSRS